MNKIVEQIEEVHLYDYCDWYHKLGDSPSKELMDEFDKEVQKWNLYDLSYKLNEDGIPRLIRYYGIPLPYVISLIGDFKTWRVFHPTGVRIKDLTLTPHTEKFRNTKLNDGSLQGDVDRSGEVQHFKLRQWGELTELDKKKKK